MSFSGSKRSCSLMSISSLVLLLTISCLLTWTLSNCKVEALRILQEEKEASRDDQENMRKITSQADHFREFFNGKVVAHSDLNNKKKNSTDNKKGFQDDKRRVPSCPDPLHN
ncbi:hypothetical protein POM88_018162 [Heracleum sosnowskyi]|uniref:Uncharacterized protein n=1 Tax=Heracleum sosnowskyi TaxID=360622 RepID=A0AAD8IRX0_9APIA|nr:hypothetical protein POM88_018162 [Heracleum sosnowskyi]